MKRFVLAMLALLFFIAMSACSTEAEYSSEYLMSIRHDISEYIQSFDEEGYKNDELCQIICSVNIVDGYVEVGLTELTKANIALFKERVSDSEAIRFVQGEEGVDDST